MLTIEKVSFNKELVKKQFTIETFCKKYKGHFKKTDVKEVAKMLGLKQKTVNSKTVKSKK